MSGIKDGTAYSDSKSRDIQILMYQLDDVPVCLHVPIGRRYSCFVERAGGFRHRSAIYHRCMKGYQAGKIVLFTAVVNDMGDFTAKFVAMHDSVNKTMFHQELAALKSWR